MTESAPKPWYRHLWPWLLIVPPAAAVIGGFLGLIAAIAFVVLGPTVWVQILGFATPIFPYEHYALFSMAIAFGGIWFFSVTDRSARAEIDKANYRHQFIRSETGLGAEGAAAH